MPFSSVPDKPLRHLLGYKSPLHVTKHHSPPSYPESNLIRSSICDLAGKAAPRGARHGLYLHMQGQPCCYCCQVWGTVGVGATVQKFPGEARAGQGPREQSALPPTAIPEGLHGHLADPRSSALATAPLLLLSMGALSGAGETAWSFCVGGASACTCCTDGDSRAMAPLIQPGCPSHC